MDKKITEKSIELIKNTFGYNNRGIHLKKCDICETPYHETNDLDFLIINGPVSCPKCAKIIELRECIYDYSNQYSNLWMNNPIYKKNLYKYDETNYGLGKITTLCLDDYDSTTHVYNRIKIIDDLINKIKNGRDFLYKELEPKIQILRSIYDKKDRFWKDGGNFVYIINNMTVEYIVIKLNEFLQSHGKISIEKIRNIIKNNINTIYKKQKIVSIKKYKKSGEIQEIEYPRFEIENYLKKMDDVLLKFKHIIDALKDFRDTQFAHIDELKNPDSKSVLTYQNIIWIFNTLKIIYDGFLYSVAPDLYTTYSVHFDVWYDHLNNISKFFEDNYKIDSNKAL